MRAEARESSPLEGYTGQTDLAMELLHLAEGEARANVGIKDKDLVRVAAENGIADCNASEKAVRHRAGTHGHM